MPSTISSLLDLLARPDFLAGLAAGAAALVILGLLAHSGLSAGWGLALCASTVASVYLTMGARHRLTLGLALLAVGGVALDKASLPEGLPAVRALAWGLLVAGAAFVAELPGMELPVWIRLLLPVVILLTGYQLRGWTEHGQTALVGPLTAVTAFGIWVTVPDTETARSLLGAAAALSVGTLRPIGARLAGPGAFALAGVVAWVAATGGPGRPGSIFGALGSLGLLVIIPMLAESAGRLRTWAVIGTHVAFVAVASRVIGLWLDPIPSAVAVIALGGATYLALFETTQRSPAPQQRERAP